MNSIQKRLLKSLDKIYEYGGHLDAILKHGNNDYFNLVGMRESQSGEPMDISYNISSDDFFELEKLGHIEFKLIGDNMYSLKITDGGYNAMNSN